MSDPEKRTIAFARPPHAKELLDGERAQKFDDLPGWTRHLIKRVIETGDLAKSAHDAGVARFVKENIDIASSDRKSIQEALIAEGITSRRIVAELLKCLDAEVTRFDKHGNPVRFLDYGLKLKTIELLVKLRGDMPDEDGKNKRSKAGVLDYFKDTPDEQKDDRPS